ncbi:MAG TPA: hypothetical protein VFJ15_00865 [Oleiagrimonas sp.]|nr:hypothetical protein [Oleiagrimonas sp.]
MRTDIGQRDSAWYRQPVAWLGALVFMSLLAGCVWTIVIATRYTDIPTHGDTPTLLGVPMPQATTVGTEDP